MITVNLKPGAKRQAPKGDAFAGLRERFKAMGEGIKQPALVVAVAAWLVVGVGILAFYFVTRSRVSAMEEKFAQTQTEYNRFHQFVIEKKKESLVRDSILSQIGTISAIDQDRFVWSHIMDEIAGAMPDFTWLTSVTPVATATPSMVDTDSTAAPPVSVVIAGQTNDLQNYTAFLRRLGESHWLTNVVPVKTETIIDKNNRPITAFTVQATFVRADSTQVRMVPILESVVK